MKQSARITPTDGASRKYVLTNDDMRVTKITLSTGETKGSASIGIGEIGSMFCRSKSGAEFTDRLIDFDGMVIKLANNPFGLVGVVALEITGAIPTQPITMIAEGEIE